MLIQKWIAIKFHYIVYQKGGDGRKNTNGLNRDRAPMRYRDIPMNYLLFSIQGDKMKKILMIALCLGLMPMLFAATTDTDAPASPPLTKGPATIRYA